MSAATQPATPAPAAAPPWCAGLTLVGLAGRAGAGKDTAADRLCERWGFVRASFAAPLKLMLEPLLEYIGDDVERLHAPGLKDRLMGRLGITPRQMMQTLGTDWGRQCLGAGVWVRCLALHLGLDEATECPVHDRIVISDVRFPNEMRFVRSLGGHLVRVERPRLVGVRDHVSEHALDLLEADTTVVNGGTVGGLHELVDGLAASLGLDEREPMPGWLT